jgi:hypothetical protein
MTENENPSATPVLSLTGALSESDERTWAMVAHLSVLLNLVTGALGPVAALVVYFIFKDRSRYVGYHALQSFLMQMLYWVGGGAIVGAVWLMTGIASAFVVGILCIPLACVITVLPVIALGYGVWGAIETSQGRDFKYWLIGDWLRGALAS